MKNIFHINVIHGWVSTCIFMKQIGIYLTDICLIHAHNGYPRTSKMALNSVLKDFYAIIFVWLYLFITFYVQIAESKIGKFICIFLYIIYLYELFKIYWKQYYNNKVKMMTVQTGESENKYRSKKRWKMWYFQKNFQS
jgi:hypothetical protein